MATKTTRTITANDYLRPIDGDSNATTKPCNFQASANIAKGTVLGRVTATGKVKAYASGNSDGSEIPIGLNMYDVVTDADGDVKYTDRYGNIVTEPSAPVYVGGRFQSHTANGVTLLLPGLDANAISKLGKKDANILTIFSA